MLRFFSSVWVLWGYNSSPRGKLYSEWHLTLRRQEQCAVILHCFHLAASLTSLWDLGQTWGDLRNQSVPGEARGGSVLLHALPPSATAQCHYAANTSNYKEPCGTCDGEQTKEDMDGDACVQIPELIVSHPPPPPPPWPPCPSATWVPTG